MSLATVVLFAGFGANAPSPLLGRIDTVNESHRSDGPTCSRIGRSERGRWPRPAAAFERVRNDSLLRNSLYIIASTVATSALGYVFWLIAARLYSPTVVGLTAAIISASTVLVLVASLGVGGTLIQLLPALSKPDRSSTFWAGTSAASITAVFLCIGTVVVLPHMSSDMSILRAPLFAILFTVGTFTLALSATLDYVFIAGLRARDLFLRNLATAIVKVGVLVALGWTAARNAFSLSAAWAISCTLGLVIGIALVAVYDSFSKPPTIGLLVRTAVGFRTAVTGHQMIGMGTGLAPYILPVIVTTRLSPGDNAYFYTTWMLAGLLFVVSDAVAQSLFAEGMHSKGNVTPVARSATKLIGAFLITGIVGVLAFGSSVLATFGPEYAHRGTTLLQIAVLASLPDALTNVYVGVLRIEGRLVVAAVMNLAMGVGTLAVTWYLLPRLGITAVGWAFLAAQFGGCLFVAIDALGKRRHRVDRAGTSSEVAP